MVMADEAHRALELVVRARLLANEPSPTNASGRWRIFAWASDWAKWASMGIFGRAERGDRGEAHARLLLASEGTGDRTMWYDMFCKGATPSALLSAGCSAAALPGIGIGVLEWHEDAGFGARELASIGGDFQNLVDMGFTVGLMFRWRATFGPHILSMGPFDVTFQTLVSKMGCSLDELIFDHCATSGDLALLGLEWENALKLGFGLEHVQQLNESHTGIEANLGAPVGDIALKLQTSIGGGVTDLRTPVCVPRADLDNHHRIGCKSFKL